MLAQRGFSIILILVLISALLAIPLFLLKNEQKPPFLQTVQQKEKIFTEKIPGSKFHSPDATWWGYNQSKIVRFGDLVFMYVVENLDDSNKTLSNLVIYLKNGDSSWQKGASFATSRPGNILVDSQGVLHTFVFEPTNVIENDSQGKLVHYWFPDAKSGDIKTYQEEVVVGAIDGVETVNIRVGAALAPDDTMVIGFGLTKFNPSYKDQSEHVYYKRPSEGKWNHAFTDGLSHDYYYPFVLATGSEFHLLPVQDDFNQGKTGVNYDNIYQKIMYFNYKNGNWTSEMIADLSNHALASSRYRLLEQSDFFEDSMGEIHILYKEFLDPQTQWKTTSIWHLTKELSGWEKKEISVLDKNIGWVRLIEIEDSLYYLGTSWNEVYLAKVGSNFWTKLDTPKDVKAIYPYVTTGKYIDVLLLGADSKEYSTTSHYYLRIPKSVFTELK